MRRLISICSSTDVEDCHIYHHGHPVEPGCDAEVPQPRFAEHRIQFIRHGGVFTAPKARFSATGEEHDVKISVKGKEKGGILALDIDEERAFEAALRRDFQGKVEFHVDGKMVDFCWNVIQRPMRFFFRTKVGGDGGCNGLEICEERSEGWHSLLIFGIV